MSCDQLWIAAGCPTRLVLVRGISNAINTETIKCARLQPDITQLGSTVKPLITDPLKSRQPKSRIQYVGSIMLAVALLVRTGGNWSFHCKKFYVSLCCCIHSFNHYNCQNIHLWLNNILAAVEIYHPLLNNVLPVVATAGVYAIYDPMWRRLWSAYAL